MCTTQGRVYTAQRPLKCQRLSITCRGKECNNRWLLYGSNIPEPARSLGVEASWTEKNLLNVTCFIAGIYPEPEIRILLATRGERGSEIVERSKVKNSL